MSSAMSNGVLRLKGIHLGSVREGKYHLLSMYSVQGAGLGTSKFINIFSCHGHRYIFHKHFQD